MTTATPLSKNFDEAVDAMRRHGMKLPNQPLSVRIPEAKRHLAEALTLFVGHEGRTFQWLPEYDEVADWLTDNHGLGLMLQGNCGRGKTLLCHYVIPYLLLTHQNMVVRAYNIQEMNRNIDDLFRLHAVSLDDIGTEEASVHYGARRIAFAEIIDSAEKTGQLVIFSTNLDIRPLTDRYGARIIDRLSKLTRQVIFAGPSLRKR
jgi:DNA replication protein DnaC